MKFLPDKMFLRVMYFIRMKKILHLKNPKLLSEKLQWLKINDRNPEYTKMVDKYEAKKYVASVIGEEYIVENYGVWDNFDDIDFDSLPNQFVIKCTHDSGGLCICKDKSKLDIEAARAKINSAFKTNYYWYSREWPYKNIKPRIIVEKYMENKEIGSIRDYKFFCFGGEAKFLYVSEGLEDHKTAGISFYGLDFEPMPFKRCDFREIKVKLEKPVNFEKMKEFAEKLSAGIPHLRVDFYEIDGNLYFGELTFYTCSGFMHLEPREWDLKIGDMLELPKK